MCAVWVFVGRGRVTRICRTPCAGVSSEPRMRVTCLRVVSHPVGAPVYPQLIFPVFWYGCILTTEAPSREVFTERSHRASHTQHASAFWTLDKNFYTLLSFFPTNHTTTIKGSSAALSFFSCIYYSFVLSFFWYFLISCVSEAA